DLQNVDNYEIFDYPGEYKIKADGDAAVKVRMEEEETPYDVVTGSSQCCSFTPGGKFTVEKHDVDSEAGKSYVITSVQHTATNSNYTASRETARYCNTFTRLHGDRTFR